MYIFCREKQTEHKAPIRRALSIVLCAALILMSCGMLAGCGEAGNYPVTVAGITLEERPKSIVCLSNAYTEILVDMGYASHLSGRPGDSELAAVQDIPPCGTCDQPAIEEIVKVGCDLLICDTTTSAEQIEQFNAQGIQVIQLLTPTTRTGFSNLYRCLGTAVDGAVDGYNAGDKAALEILVKLDDVERAVMSENAVNVCIFRSNSLSKSVTGDCLGNVLIELAGGFNVAVEGKNGFIPIETVALSNPDVIICTKGGEGEVRSQRVLEKCSAIKNNRIYVYESDKFDSLGYDLVLCAWELARLIHPEIISADMLPNGAVDYIPTYQEAVIHGDEYEEYSSSVEEQKTSTQVVTSFSIGNQTQAPETETTKSAQ